MCQLLLLQNGISLLECINVVYFHCKTFGQNINESPLVMVMVCSMPVANEYTYQVTNEFIKTIRQDAYCLTTVAAKCH